MFLARATMAFFPMPSPRLFLLLSVFCWGGARAGAGAAAAPPNIIFVLADDYGTGEVGCYGADHYVTPHLDALARSGTRYTQAFTAALCGPSRAMILSGRYPFRTGATNQDATGNFTPAQETLMPAVLKTAGYATAAIGKWGQLPQDPAAFGFDETLQFKGSGVYWNTQAKGKEYLVNGAARSLGDGEYLPDLMHQHAVNFIEKHRAQPFYLYYSLSHVHVDILPTPDSAPGSKDLYGDNVAYLDKLIGKLVAELERLKLREKTLLVFCGDNGTAKVRAARATRGGRPLLGSKGSMQEGGGLVPLIASWPGTTAAGQVSAQLIDSSDFFPTFAELAGAALPAKKIVDGHSFAAQLRGEKGAPRAWIFNQLARQWYVREAGWKLDQAGQLFDMAEAPFAERLVSGAALAGPAAAARDRLQAALARLNPAGGILDNGDGTGRHAGRAEKPDRKPAK